MVCGGLPSTTSRRGDGIRRDPGESAWRPCDRVGYGSDGTIPQIRDSCRPPQLTLAGGDQHCGSSPAHPPPDSQQRIFMADYDIAIIGGGINGAGIARDAAGRGLKVLLVEMNDLGS